MVVCLRLWPVQRKPHIQYNKKGKTITNFVCRWQTLLLTLPGDPRKHWHTYVCRSDRTLNRTMFFLVQAVTTFSIWIWVHSGVFRVKHRYASVGSSQNSGLHFYWTVGSELPFVCILANEFLYVCLVTDVCVACTLLCTKNSNGAWAVSSNTKTGQQS